MDVDIYKTTDPVNKIKKSITFVQTIQNIYFVQGEHSVLTPVITFGGVDTLNSFEGNYAKITALGITRYYFITNISSNKKFVMLQLQEDVLMTYQNAILSSTQLVERNENNKNLMIADNSEPIHSDQTFEAIPFGADVLDKNNCNLILSTAGTGSLT